MTTSVKKEKLQQKLEGLQGEVQNLAKQLEQDGLDKKKLDEISTQLDDRVLKFKAAEVEMTQLVEVERITDNAITQRPLEQIASNLTQVGPRSSEDENRDALRASLEFTGMGILFGGTFRSNGLDSPLVRQSNGNTPILGQFIRKNDKKIKLIQGVKRRNIFLQQETLSQHGQAMPEDFVSMLVDKGDKFVQAMGQGQANAGAGITPAEVYPMLEHKLGFHNTIRRVATIRPRPNMAPFSIHAIAATSAGAGAGSAAIYNENVANADTQDLYVTPKTSSEIKPQRIGVDAVQVSYELMNTDGVINFMETVFEELSQELGIQEAAQMANGTGNIKGYTGAVTLANARALSGKTFATTIGDLARSLHGLSGNKGIPYRNGAVVFMHDELIGGYLAVTVGAADRRNTLRIAIDTEGGDSIGYLSDANVNIYPDNNLQGPNTAGTEMVANKRSWYVIARRGAFSIPRYMNDPIQIGLFEELAHFQAGQVAVSARMWTGGAPDPLPNIGAWKTTS